MVVADKQDGQFMGMPPEIICEMISLSHLRVLIEGGVPGRHESLKSDLCEECSIFDVINTI
ncbi:hypothetical protein KSB_88770 [Ktedonobacter robiniae]|uniref:Uncharacterized protein n=1 Tax=Ktedonobacter robiniae TaxID=2778365 RepID=A0ABQ3V796_9CHLR|nr:hypothetical protein KSB_88770 [Ktedonobacter robiniae]